MENKQENKHLICPITQDLFEDPISVPCCGQTYSRTALVQSLQFARDCPMCRGDLSRFDAALAAKNVVIAGLVDDFKDENCRLRTHAPQVADWEGTVQEIVDPSGASTGAAYRTLVLNDAAISVKPTLFIAVCDRSGSMSGQPWSQVEEALLHMIGLSQGNKVVQLGCIMYESTAEIIDISRVSRANIRSYFTGGGTVFPAAFVRIGELLRANRNGVFDRAVVAFMTDGQSGQDRNMLATELRGVINNSWQRPIVVHTIGFGACDKDLLELLRGCGSEEGVFRFADANDSADTLTLKITDLFDEVSRAAYVELMLDGNIYRMPVVNRQGTLEQYLAFDSINGSADQNMAQYMKSIVELGGRQHEIQYEVIESKYDAELFLKWVRRCLDKLAANVLAVNECKDADEQRISVSVLKQQVKKMGNAVVDPDVLASLELINDQLGAIQEKRVIDVGRLRDMRFASRFAVRKANGGAKGRDLEIRKAILPATVPLLGAVAYNEPRLKTYGYQRTDLNRNELQKIIMSCLNPCRTVELVSALDLTKEMILHEDSDGNNALHLAAYDGQYSTLEVMFKHVTLDEASRQNPNTDSVFTLAIKKQGWDKTLAVIVKFGVSCSVERMKALQRHCVDYGYLRTSAILQDLINAGGVVSDEISVEIAKELSVAYVRFVYNNWRSAGRDTSPFWKVALSKGYEMFDLARAVYDECKIDIEIEDLLNWCYPKKPDAEDTDRYIEMATFLLDAKPALISMTNAAGETALYRAVEKGSLPHVKLMIQRKADIEAKNELGNTALWLACAKKYPCIIEELLDCGADINATNLKGNPPLYTTCQVGPLKVAEMLMIRGAQADTINANGDTLVLIATRNGQAEILELLLRYVSNDFANHVAHIDGFNAVFASVEANRVGCIDVLWRHGMNYNQRTAKDNAILSDATPLHLAAYYNRVEACQKLLEIGVEIDAESGDDVLRTTPLQIAAIQGNVEIAKLLVAAGADRSKALMFASGAIKELLIDDLDISRLDLIKTYWHKYWNTVDILDEESNTPLIWAVLEGNVQRIQQLMLAGANSKHRNRYGLSAQDYAKFMRMARIEELVGKVNVSVLDRLSPAVKQLLYLNGIRREFVETSFADRMKIVEGDVAYYGEELNAVVKYINRAEQLREVLPMARLRALNFIANNHATLDNTYERSTAQLVMEVYRIVGANLDPVGLRYIADSAACLPAHEGEIFVNLDRRFAVGSNVSVAKPFSGSSLWRIATHTFDPKRGTVGIFKNSTARYLGGNKCEVFVPAGKYVVTNVYHYDPICLGQANIRSHTFKIKDTDLIQAVVLMFEAV